MTLYNIKELWRKACRYDHIPINSKFVVFSKENPFVKEWNDAVGSLQRALKR